MPSNMSMMHEDSRGFQKSKLQSAKVLAARTNPMWYVVVCALTLGALVWGGLFAWKQSSRPGARGMRALEPSQAPPPGPSLPAWCGCPGAACRRPPHRG